jgi:uncharacterized protein YciI
LFHVLFYDYVPDIVERRAPYRAEHLERIAAERSEGRMVMGGPIGDPPVGAVFVFDSKVPLAAVEEFVSGDPYVRAEIVSGWRIEPWNTLPG